MGKEDPSSKYKTLPGWDTPVNGRLCLFQKVPQGFHGPNGDQMPKKRKKIVRPGPRRVKFVSTNKKYRYVPRALRLGGSLVGTRIRRVFPRMSLKLFVDTKSKDVLVMFSIQARKIELLKTPCPISSLRHESFKENYQ